MIQKKEFMLLFRVDSNDDYQPTESEINEQHQQWGTFIGTIAIQEKLVSAHQLGLLGCQILSNKTVMEGIHVTEKQSIGGNMIIIATGLREATAMAMSCPILLIGGTVEVR